MPGGPEREPGAPVSRLDRAVEIGFVACSLLATGWPTGACGWPMDLWPFFLAALATALVHHARCGLSFAGRRPRGFPLLVLLAAASVVALFTHSRGRLLMGDGLVRLWALACLHWAASGGLAGTDGRHPAARHRISLVPTTLMPLALLHGSGSAPGSSPEEAVLLLIGYGLHRALRPGSLRLADRLSRLPSWLPLGLALAPLVGLAIDLGRPKVGPVLFDAGHGSTEGVEIDSLPSDRRASPPPGHGALLGLARRLGYEVGRVTGALDEESLKRASVLVVLLNRRPFEPAERRLIERFVDRGGGLLVVGDHTDIDGTSSAMNPLLAVFGARLRFDSVWRRLDAGVRDIHVLPHALTLGLRRLHSSVGASLDLRAGTLEPVVVGGAALFSDAGDASADGNLGDGVRSDGEPVGDLTLAAAGRHGLGRVVVLPDSAYLQNEVIPPNREFAARVLWWLSRSEPFRWARPARAILSWVFVVLTILLAMTASPSRPIVPVAALIGAALAFAAGAAAARQVARVGRAGPPSPAAESTVVVDLAHGNRCSFFWTRGAEGAERDSMDVWLREVTARGFDVTFHDPPDGPIDDPALRRAWLLVMADPQRPLARSEIEAVRRFVRAGGRLLLLWGPGSGSPGTALLDAFGLTVSQLPVGVARPMLYADEFALRLPYKIGTFPVATVTRGVSVTALETVVPVDPVEVGGGEPLLTALGRTVAVVKREAAGTVVLLGDREHFTNFAFEAGANEVDLGRVRFLADLMSFMKGGRP
ncbi:MAG: hypothetical protein HY815_23790 [Candidatus Riflebacteria bacterium]|nr:hypothetical protein [Candidatus Riflebacteria bacterium]